MNAATLTTLAALKNSGRSVATPFSLALPDHGVLICETVLRLLPEKRIVLRGRYQQQTVLVKLFFDTHNWQKECTGFERLQKTGVATPTLLLQQAVEQGGVCLFAFIDNAQPLDVLWQHADETTKRDYLALLLPNLQTLWQQQVLQQDLHLGNFLLQTQADDSLTLWTLDPASCVPFSHAEARQKNLALLLAQLPVADWDFAVQALQADTDIQPLAQQQWRQRLHHYLRKIFRDCTEVADLSPHNNLRILCQRHALTANFLACLQNPSALANHAAMLKNGNSAKVFRIEMDGRLFVVKQYINKDWLRKLRRAFRPSRAARSWRFAHMLAFAGVRVPKPVALIEQKTGPLVTSAWYISEYCADTDLLARWQTQMPSTEELHSLRALFAALQALHIHHGDMKASNLLSDGKTLAVIDYDGAQEHRNTATLQQALQKDKQRLLQNWSNNEALQQQLSGCLAV